MEPSVTVSPVDSASPASVTLAVVASPIVSPPIFVSPVVSPPVVSPPVVSPPVVSPPVVSPPVVSSPPIVASPVVSPPVVSSPPIVASPIVSPPAEKPLIITPLLDIDLAPIFNLIVTDYTFIANVKAAMERIMKDGSVTESDIPDIILVISETVNAMKSVRVTADQLSGLLKMLFHYVMDSYKLITADKKAAFDKLLETSLRLFMIKPDVKQAVRKFFSFFPCCA